MNRAKWIGPGRLGLTALAAAGLVTAAVVAPADGRVVSDATPVSATTRQPIASASLSCPGPELSGIDGVDDLEVPARVGAATAPESVLGREVQVTGSGKLAVTSGGETKTSGETTTRGESTTVDELPNGDASDVVATGSLAPGLAAAQEWAVARAELRGLATVPCAGPGADMWLVAGGGAAGRQERLILTNPGANEVSVDLQALGRKGLLASPTGSVVVPAHGRVSMLVDAITGAEESPAVRVLATGGSVRAVMSDIWLDGSVAAGAETSVPTAAPSKHQVIPAALISAAGGSIRIAVPDRQQAVVSARVIGPDGVVPLSGGGVTRVPGRSTSELPITGLKAGTYAVEVTSDVPVVAALWSSWRVGTGVGDFAWAPSTPAATGLLGGAYPSDEDGPERSVDVVVTGGPAKVALTWRAGADWKTEVFDLSQDTARAVDVGRTDAIWVRKVSGAGEVRSSVASTSGQNTAPFVSVSPLVDTPVTSEVSRAFPVS
ncbi:DUF5719 family protein [Knoellia subterranea]|uniref:Secreted protein n=1 Tax=Knoellia subterranea KCTC 19937 TaxID=1385521 RepID=A0A0A0JMX1_9MICO|nr:DUF5719 family protein [Knoellia subterranea]KGN36961.1 hypothetical protein N803_16225 [Knoellia subterranea KCTC 19937]